MGNIDCFHNGNFMSIDDKNEFREWFFHDRGSLVAWEKPIVFEDKFYSIWLRWSDEDNSHWKCFVIDVESGEWSPNLFGTQGAWIYHYHSDDSIELVKPKATQAARDFLKWKKERSDDNEILG